MSAFIVDKAHIDAIVAVALFGPSDSRSSSWRGREPYMGQHKAEPGTANLVGQQLIDTNVLSIKARYPDCIDNPENTPGPCEQYWNDPYAFPVAEPHQYTGLPTTAEALKIIACYEYQACEFPDWENSLSYHFCNSLRSRLVWCIPAVSEEDAWEWPHDLFNRRPVLTGPALH